MYILTLTSVYAMRNPAAVYCKALGYKYVIEKTEKGDWGVCILDDGKIVDAWKFFLGEEMKEKSYCARNGYELKIIKSDKCKKYGLNRCAACIVNGSEIEIGELMNLDFKENITKPQEFSSPKPPKKPAQLSYYSLYFALFVIILIIILTTVVLKQKH